MTTTKCECDGYLFDFTDAINVFKFDETDSSKPMFHGAPMKAIDLIAEFVDAYVFVELKDYSDQDPDAYNPSALGSVEEMKERRLKMKWLKNYLKYKYRDTLLFRHAEAKVNKPIHYICLMTFDNAMSNAFTKLLRQDLPLKRHQRWTSGIVKSCHVVNFERWQKNYPAWQVTKLNAT